MTAETPRNRLEAKLAEMHADIRLLKQAMGVQAEAIKEQHDNYDKLSGVAYDTRGRLDICQAAGCSQVKRLPKLITLGFMIMGGLITVFKFFWSQ